MAARLLRLLGAARRSQEEAEPLGARPLLRGLELAAASAADLKPISRSHHLVLLPFRLSDEEMAALDALERGERTYWDNSQVP